MNKTKNFFKPTSAKFGITLLLVLVFVVLTFKCAPGYLARDFTGGGERVYPCGKVVGATVLIPFSYPISIALYLAVFYILSCTVLHLLSKVKSGD